MNTNLSRATFELIASDETWSECSRRLQATSAAPLCTPVFCAPHWIDAAWQWRRPGAKRHFIARADAGRLTGIVPLIQIEERLLGIRARTLQWLTVPDTQCADICTATEDAPSFSEGLANLLAANEVQWDRVQLSHLSNAFPNWRHLGPALMRRRLKCVVEPAGENPYVDLTGSFDSYYSGRSRSLKKSVNLSTNRLNKSGKVDVDWIRGGTATASALADAVRVSSISWKQQTGSSLDHSGPKAFIGALTAAADPLGQLSIWLLRLDGKVIASEYQIISDGNVYALRSDFDPVCAEMSPGTFLNHYVLKSVFGLGLHRYYMGPGSNAYKLRWTDSFEPLFRLTAYNTTWIGRMAHWLEQEARPRLRALRSRISPP